MLFSDIVELGLSDRTRTSSPDQRRQGDKHTTVLSIPAYCTWATNTNSTICVTDQAQVQGYNGIVELMTL